MRNTEKTWQSFPGGLGGFEILGNFGFCAIPSIPVKGKILSRI